MYGINDNKNLCKLYAYAVVLAHAAFHISLPQLTHRSIELQTKHDFPEGTVIFSM